MAGRGAPPPVSLESIGWRIADLSYLDDLFSTIKEDLRNLEHALIKASETAAAAATEHDPENPIRVRAEAEAAAALSDHHNKTTELAGFLEENPEYHVDQ
jgi:hypothetical protein